MVTYKKDTGKPRVAYSEAVEEALCFGWIDSRPNALDAERSMLLFTPRKAGSEWSRINKARVESLMAAGRMKPAGIEKVEAAKRDGSWNALDAVEALELPEDLVAALEEHPEAERHFAAFPRGSRKIILGWVLRARRPETRQRRIRETVELAAKNLRAGQWKPPERL